MFPKVGTSGRTPPNCTIFRQLNLKNFIFANEPFAEGLRVFETCVLVQNALCGN